MAVLVAKSCRKIWSELKKGLHLRRQWGKPLPRQCKKMEKMEVTKLYTLLYHDGHTQWYSSGLWESKKEAVEHGKNFSAVTAHTTFEVKTLITID